MEDKDKLQELLNTLGYSHLEALITILQGDGPTSADFEVARKTLKDYLWAADMSKVNQPNSPVNRLLGELENKSVAFKPLPYGDKRK